MKDKDFETQSENFLIEKKHKKAFKKVFDILLAKWETDLAVLKYQQKIDGINTDKIEVDFSYNELKLIDSLIRVKLINIESGNCLTHKQKDFEYIHEKITGFCALEELKRTIDWVGEPQKEY